MEPDRDDDALLAAAADDPDGQPSRLRVAWRPQAGTVT